MTDASLIALFVRPLNRLGIPGIGLRPRGPADPRHLSWRAQKDRLLAVDSLRPAVVALQDSILWLVSDNAHAYQAGYDAAYTGYQDLSRRYVAKLRKPRITFGRSFGLIAAAGAGFMLARATHE